MSILVPITNPERERVRTAAKRACMSQRQFCRRAILAAVGHRVSGAPLQTEGPDAKDAVAALVQLGIGAKDARQRVQRIDGGLPADELIRQALKGEPC